MEWNRKEVEHRDSVMDNDNDETVAGVKGGNRS